MINVKSFLTFIVTTFNKEFKQTYLVTYGYNIFSAIEKTFINYKILGGVK